MFRDGGEADRIFMHEHFLALYGGDLAGGHLKALGNCDYFLLFNLEVIQNIPRGDICAFDFLIVNRQAGIRGEIRGHKVSPVGCVVNVRIEGFLFSERGDPLQGQGCKFRRQIHEGESASPVVMLLRVEVGGGTTSDNSHRLQGVA